jgi:hypothetical protein
MESIDEFKTQCDQQRQPQKKVRPVTGHRGSVQIARHMKHDVAKAHRQRQQENHNPCAARRPLHFVVEKSDSLWKCFRSRHQIALDPIDPARRGPQRAAGARQVRWLERF